MNRDTLARKADLLQKYLEELESIGTVLSITTLCVS